jgi:hypothetical protein
MQIIEATPAMRKSLKARRRRKIAANPAIAAKGIIPSMVNGDQSAVNGAKAKKMPSGDFPD